jgi:hypothetical protein
MKKFIGYFDYLGFKDFILNNDLAYQNRIMNNIFRDIESALGNGKYKEASIGVIADLSESRINCVNFSDTVVFWTKDASIDSLKELLDVTYQFNYQAIEYFFPARGAIFFGDIVHVDFRQQNEGGGLYNLNSIFGQGLVEAHLKTEQQAWAGSVIDQSVINVLLEREINPDEFLKEYAKKYKIPYKPEFEVDFEEFALCLCKGNLNDEAFKNVSNSIARNFTDHKKSIDHPDVKLKLENTIKFLESFKVN